MASVLWTPSHQVRLLAGLQRAHLVPRLHGDVQVRLRTLDGGHTQHLPGGKDRGIAGLDLVEQARQLYPCLSKKVLQF